MAIKLLDNSAKFEVFSQFDESIDGQSEEGNAAFSKYVESLNISDLLLKPGAEPPTPFVVRCLLTKERAELQEKHIKTDPVTKKTDFVHGYPAYLTDCFDRGCLGVKASDGAVTKITSEEVDVMHVLSIGSLIAVMTTVGKNRKNV